MDIKREMLESSGVYTKKNIVSDLLAGGLFFNDNLDKDLTIAVRSGVMSLTEANKLKRLAKSGKEYDYFFETLLPKVKESLEESMMITENSIEHSTSYEESTTLEEWLEIQRDRYNRIKDL